MVSNESNLANNLKSAQRKSFQSKLEQPGQWAQVVGQVMEKVVSGTNVTTTISFDNLVPRAQGPEGRDLGGATWKLNGKVVWTTEAHKAQD
jgi:hypothetical protein